jgi:thymidylate synthase
MRQYLDLMQRIIDEGEDVQSGALLVSEKRKPKCRFLLSPQLRFDLRRGFPAVTTKQLHFDVVVDEVLWFLRGDTNVRKLGRWIVPDESPEGGGLPTFIQRHIWDSWAQPDGDVPHAYGEGWRHWEYLNTVMPPDGQPGVTMVCYWDQVDALIKDLRAVIADPANRARRRIMLTAWNPPLVPEMGLPPCHTLAQWLPTNGYLDCVCHWRSIDTFTGMPFNIAQYALLQTIFAVTTGLVPRHLVCNVADCHLYDNQFVSARAQCARDPLPAPILRIDDRFWETAPDLAVAQLREVDHAWFRLEGYEYIAGKLKAEVAV